ncbi:hypothetical protein DTO271G3_2823 [Paecilomyces variotii]|nr:hypothetical protein DTO271G3_2823 [Paecilomyces variotii]
MGEIPDFILFGQNGTTALVGEIKTPWTTDLDNMDDDDFKSVWGQIARYMDDCHCRYGVVSTYRQTVFVKRTGDYTFARSQVVTASMRALEFLRLSVRRKPCYTWHTSLGTVVDSSQKQTSPQSGSSTPTVDMGEFPRQQDLTEAVRDLEADFADETMKPSVPPPRPTSEGVSELLAAIYKLEKRDHIQAEPSRREANLPTSPSHPPIDAPKRVAEIVDSLANLSVSQPKHEVIAVALRVDSRSHSMELIVSGNSDIPSSTLDHLRFIWTSLKALSDFIYANMQPGLQDKYPNEKTKDPAFRAIVADFNHRCLEFTFARLQQKVNGKFPQFMNIPTDGLPSEHPFNSLRETLLYLERVFTRKEGAIYGKPHHDDTDNWRLIYSCLRAFSQASGLFLRAGGFQGEDKRSALGFPKLHSYIQKIASIFNNIDILVKAAISPRRRDFFTCDLSLTPIAMLSGRLPHIAENASDWKRVLEESLAYYNSFSDLTNLTGPGQVLDLRVTDADATYMAQEAVSKDVIVHCETKLLAAIEKAQNEGGNVPKAFTYIGVSKLSCHGCACFFAAYNRVHGTSWRTGGSHRKSYYAWMFPPVIQRKHQVLTTTYATISAKWVNSYRGYQHSLASLEFEGLMWYHATNNEPEDEGYFPPNADIITPTENMLKAFQETSRTRTSPESPE